MPPAKSNSTNIGQHGEQMAAEFLVRSGYEILARNCRTKVYEIDIVARKGRTLYFVEVKYRATKAQGDGFDYITDKKIWHMQRAAELWVLQNAWKGEYVLMAVSVVGESGEVDLRELT